MKRSVQDPLILPQVYLLLALALSPGCADPHRIRVREAGSGTSVQSEGDLKVVLLLTDDLEEVKERWAQPTPPTLRPINAAKLGDPVHAVIIFTGCAADSSGFCQVVSHLTITDPEGRLRKFNDERAVWLGMPPPASGQLQIAQEVSTFGVTSGPLGKYTVSVTVNDRVSGRSLDLVVPLVLH